MKKTGLVLFSLAAVLFSACSWQAPEKISVKTNAKYSFSMGTIEPENLNLNFSKDEIFKSLPMENAKVYDYFPEKKDANVQRFLMQIPLMEVPVDIGSYFDKSTLADSVKGMSFEQEFEVPSIDFSAEEAIEIGELSKAINALVSFTGPVLASGVSPTFAGKLFTKITYNEGSLEVTCANMPDGENVTLSSGGKNSTATFIGGKASILLNNFSIIQSDVTVKFSKTLPEPFFATVKEDSKIKSAEGITAALPMALPLEFDIDAMKDAADTFEKCEIATGSITTKIVIPSSWTGIDLAYELAATGGITAGSVKSSGVEKKISLDNVVIKPSETHIKAGIYIALNNATYVPADSLKFVCSSEIKKIKSVALELHGIEKHISATDKLDSLILDTVKSIEFGSSGLKAKFENDLPAGNNITFSVVSKFLGLNDTKTLLTGENSDFEIMTSGTNKIFLSKTPDEANRKFDSWDFDVELKLPGATVAKPDRIEIKNVEPGKKYKIGFKVEPVLDWKEITIDTSNIKINSEDLSEPIELDLGLGNALDSLKDTLGTEFVNSLKIPELNIYLYCIKPNLTIFDNARLVGEIPMQLVDGSGNVIKDEDGIPLSKDFCENGISFVNSPKLEMDKTDKNLVISDISKMNDSVHIDIARFINASLENSDSKIKLDYNVTFSNSNDGSNSITITPELLEDNTDTSISIFALIDIPLAMQISTASLENIDFNKMLGMEDGKDLLGRNEATSLTDIENYIDVIKSASINYNFKQFPVKGLENVSVVLDMKSGSKPKTFGMKSGTIDISISDVRNIFETYPFCPTVKLEGVDKGTKISIPRELGVAVNLALCLETDGEIDIMGGKK